MESNKRHRIGTISLSVVFEQFESFSGWVCLVDAGVRSQGRRLQEHGCIE